MSAGLGGPAAAGIWETARSITSGSCLTRFEILIWIVLKRPSFR